MSDVMAESIPRGDASTFLAWAEAMRPAIETQLAQHLDALNTHAVALHSPLVAAMRHGVMNGGKRIRALLAVAASQWAGVPEPSTVVMRVAVALEYIHAYSLIHDDLPCMDDDDLRRGQPTVHIVYGQDQALLAGDALQTLAFELLSAPELGIPPQVQLDLMRTLAHQAGVLGMAGGQAIDCYHVAKPMAEATMRTMHRLKTGALLHASVMMGAACGSRVSHQQTADLSLFAHELGLLFQVVDDILDAVQDTAVLGKTAGKDAQANKPTYVQAMGIEGARDYAQTLYHSALTHLAAASTQTQQAGAQYLAHIAAYCHERLY